MEAGADWLSWVAKGGSSCLEAIGVFRAVFPVIIAGLGATWGISLIEAI